MNRSYNLGGVLVAIFLILAILWLVGINVNIG